jgi:molybdopterin-containing oxidoreductase family iron-sulfur binding subunit
MSGTSGRFDLAEIRRRIAATSPARVWSSLEELVDEAGFRRWVEAEFPTAASFVSEHGRREFLRLMGASLMLSGVAGCGERGPDLALPYVTEPEHALPGVPRLYATAVVFEGFAQPILARTNDGRPTKLDGNPEHPATRGRSDVFMQTAVLELYDPDRSKSPMRDGLASTWAAFAREVVALRQDWSARRGEGLRILAGNITSPTLVRQLTALVGSLPNSRVHIFEPVGSERRQEAMRIAFGRDVDAHYHLENCETVVCLDDDLLGPGPRQVAHAQGWPRGRGEIEPAPRVRLHVAESVPTLTGSVASARLPLDASRLPHIALALAAELDLPGAQTERLTDVEAKWIDAAARDLKNHAGRSLLSCGSHVEPAVQALAPWVNQSLGNVGAAISYTEPVGFQAAEGSSLGEPARAIDAGSVDTLVILDSNPVYAAPGALDFRNLIAKVPQTIHVGLYQDETAKACHWHVPLSHALESWSDARAVDGTVSIIQPLVGPLYSTRTMPQILAMLAGTVDPDAESLVRATWVETFADQFATRWRKSLHDGFIAGTQAPQVAVTARVPELSAVQGRNIAPGVEVAFRPDPCVWDGRFGNIAWLQELPKPLTKITWDCPVAVSPHMADHLRLANGDLVEVAIDGRRIIGPAWIMPGQAPNTVALFLGYGRTAAGQVARDVGYSAYLVRPADNAWSALGAIRRVDGSRPFATTQLHHRMEGFDFVREVSAEHPTLPIPAQQSSLYPEWGSADYAWGMVIDLDLCIGCNACVSACNVENNVLVVGKDQVARGREMLWLRVDRYYEGDVENPRSFFQPVPCMHCEKAPCEMGCPVHATVHNAEGLNQMVYNRCIGTRTCSSYCPYKVRRFNWYDYRRFDEPSKAAHNPDVTVRSRGVMEKCTYCTQRIQAAHAAADKENRRLEEGEVVTACQQACPTAAIAFGNLKYSNAKVAKLRQSGRHYVLLEQLGTRPRTTYLARWRDEPHDRNVP